MKRKRFAMVGTAGAMITTGVIFVMASGETYTGPDWGIYLTAPPYNVQPVALTLEPATKQAIQIHSGVSDAQLDAAELYSARTTSKPDPDANIRLLIMPATSEPGETARMAVGVDTGGVVTTAGFWGTEQLLLDEGAGWNRFSWQMNNRSIDAASTLGDVSDTRDAYWDALQQSTTPEDVNARLLYEHRILMFANGYLIGHTWELVNRQGVAPPPEWFESYVTAYQRMADMADGLSTIIGEDAAAEYRTRALGDIPRLREAAEASSNGDVRKVGKLITKGFRTQSCGTCHAISGHTLGAGKLDAALKARMSDLGARNDLFQVDRDIWPVPGDEEQSQEFANAVRAALLVLDTVRDGS